MLDDSKKILEILKDINNKLDKIGKKLGEDKIQSSIKIEKQSTKKSSKIEKKKNKTGIIELFKEAKEEGFFDKPRTRADIVKKFEEMGHIYSNDSLNQPLIRAVRSRILGRKKIDGNWGYVKR